MDLCVTDRLAARSQVVRSPIAPIRSTHSFSLFSRRFRVSIHRVAAGERRGSTLFSSGQVLKRGKKIQTSKSSLVAIDGTGQLQELVEMGAKNRTAKMTFSRFFFAIGAQLGSVGRFFNETRPPELLRAASSFFCRR